MAELAVEADLRLQVTNPAGRSTTARITGHGRELRVDVEQPDVLFAAVDSADVGRVAELLSETGITVRVVGPDGLAATIGAGTSSWLGKAVTGSSAVGPRPLAAARIAAGMRAVQVGALAIGIALVVGQWWRRTRT